MLRRTLSLLVVLLVVAGCSSAPEDTSSLAGEGEVMVSERVPITGLDGVETADAPPVVEQQYGPEAGTQQDLVINVGDRVFFGYDKYDLRPEARAMVERQAEWLQTYPNLRVTVEGHADERGTREYNLALGEKRAMAVRNYLIALGVNPDRLETVSFGKERPAVLGASDASWAQNRRSVLVVE